MIESEIHKRCPDLYESLKAAHGEINWSEIFSHLEKLNWLLIPETVDALLNKALQLINDVEPHKLSIIKLDEVKFHINSLVFHLSINKKTSRKYTEDFIDQCQALSFFKTNSNQPVERIEPRFEMIQKLIHTCFMHLELQFLAITRKTIPQYLGDLFYTNFVSGSYDELSQTPNGRLIIQKYPKPRMFYIPYFSKVPAPVNNYYGEMVRNTKHGFGLESFSNGDQYKGEFRENLMHGEGTYYFNNGGYFEGSFSRGCIDGHGTEHYPSGNVYIGEFFKGKKHGKGEMLFSNGDRYIGEWKDNYMEGSGEFSWSSGVVFKGWFLRDKRSGKGEITMDNGAKYCMDWIDDQIV